MTVPAHEQAFTRRYVVKYPAHDPREHVRDLITAREVKEEGH